MSAVGESASEHNWLRMWAGQPQCCRDVVARPKNIGVVLKTISEAVCRDGCHRIVEVKGSRLVYDRRTGSANPVWQS